MAKNFTLRVADENVAQELNEYCEKYCVSRNKLINKLIRDFLESIKKQNKNIGVD